MGKYVYKCHFFFIHSRDITSARLYYYYYYYY